MVGPYPLSIPINGMALNITCNSYVDNMDFGLTGCRRTVPHLQRLLTHLDDELGHPREGRRRRLSTGMGGMGGPTVTFPFEYPQRELFTQVAGASGRSVGS